MVKFGRKMWKIGFKEICERSFLHRPLWMEKKLNIFCFMWMVTTGLSQQRKILTIKWIGPPVLWIPRSLSLAFSIITQWAHKQSSHGYKNGDFVQAEQCGLPPTKASLANDIVECPVCQQWKATVSPWYGTISSQQVDYSGLFPSFPSWKGQHFCSHWIRHLFWIQIYLFL